MTMTGQIIKGRKGQMERNRHEGCKNLAMNKYDLLCASHPITSTFVMVLPKLQKTNKR